MLDVKAFTGDSNATGIVTGASGYYVTNGNVTGVTLTNQYGLYIESLTGATNNYSIYTGSAQSYFGGNVGIGITVPVGLLSVGPYAPTATLGVYGDVSILSNSNSLPGILAIRTTDSSSSAGDIVARIFLEGSDGGESTLDAGTVIEAIASEGLWAQGKGHHLAFRTKANTTNIEEAATERMRITEAGYVGIGTDDPQQKLHMHGGSIAFSSTEDNYPSYITNVRQDSNSQGIMLGVTSSGIAADALTITHDKNATFAGNVIIGSDTSAGYADTLLNVGKASMGNTEVMTRFNVGDGGHTTEYFLSFRNAVASSAVEVLRVNTLGHVHIGVGAPDYPLSVVDTGPWGSGVYIKAGGAASSGFPAILVENALGHHLFEINGGTKIAKFSVPVQINNTLTTTGNVTVNGQLTQTRNTSGAWAASFYNYATDGHGVEIGVGDGSSTNAAFEVQNSAENTTYFRVKQNGESTFDGDVDITGDVAIDGALTSQEITTGGSATFGGHIVPDTNNVYNLGAGDKFFLNAYLYYFNCATIACSGDATIGGNVDIANRNLFLGDHGWNSNGNNWMYLTGSAGTAYDTTYSNLGVYAIHCDSTINLVGALTGSTASFTGTVTAASGILFGSDTAAENTLHDYEEGTWIPTLNASGTATMSNCKYVKIGSLVQCWANIQNIQESGTQTADLIIAGLPFTVAYDVVGGTLMMKNVNLDIATGPVCSWVRTDETIYLYETRNSDNWDPIEWEDITDNDYIYMEFSYRTND